MSSFPDSIESTAFISYIPPEDLPAKSRPPTEKTHAIGMTLSFNAQIMDSRLLRPHLSRECILAGDYPRPIMGDGLPMPYQGTCEELLDVIARTVHTTIDHLDYNGLTPYIKTLEQMKDGRSFIETTMDSRNEEPGTTCVGMSHALMKVLREKHGIEGCFAAQRIQGQPAFGHASVIVECSDGYVLLDPRDNPDHRIFSIPFDQTIQPTNGLSLSASSPGSMIPLLITCKDDMGKEWRFEHCTNIANADDLVMKHFMMESPFVPPDNPAFPIGVHYPKGGAAKIIWVSPLKSKLTLKNLTLPKSDPGRTEPVSFQEVQDGLLHSSLERLYDTGSPTFHIPLETLHGQLRTFVENAEVIHQIFQDIFYTLPPS